MRGFKFSLNLNFNVLIIVIRLTTDHQSPLYTSCNSVQYTLTDSCYFEGQGTEERLDCFHKINVLGLARYMYVQAIPIITVH